MNGRLGSPQAHVLLVLVFCFSVVANATDIRPLSESGTITSPGKMLAPGAIPEPASTFETNSLAANNTTAVNIIYVNKPASEADFRYEYPHKLLEMTLSVTEAEYGEAIVKHTSHVMTRGRMYYSLLDGQKLHVVAEAVKPLWTENLEVVRIPIRKGIQGYRLFLINQQNQAALSKIKTIEQLRLIPTGSGDGWSTSLVLSEAGFNVVIGSQYDGLFEMLKHGRFTTFNRGINEIGTEYALKKPNNPDLAIESDLALYIPLPTYFFITPEKPALARRIEKGLNLLIENGEFERYFLTHHQDLINAFDFTNRKIFKLKNPNLGAADPVDQSNLWHQF